MIHTTVLMRICGVLLYWSILGTNGQGTMVEPPSRSSLWRFGFDTPINENDRLLSCGGVKHRWMTNNGRCGVCGDPWDSNLRPNEAGGLYASGIITDVYVKGSVVDVTVDIAVNNGGYFEFRLCPHDNPSTPVSQRCLDEGLLSLASGNGSRFETVKQGLNVVKLQLPPNLVCDQCVLQWKYRAADHLGCERNAKTNEEVCDFGLGKIQTEYFSCADIAIYEESYVLSLPDSGKKLNTFVVPGKGQNKTREKRAIMQAHRTLIFPNGQIQMMDYGPPFSPVAPYMAMMAGGNGPPPNMNKYSGGPDMRWGWGSPGNPGNRGDNTGRMRRMVQETMQSDMQRLPGQAFRGGNVGHRDPSNVNVGIGEMYPGGRMMPQSAFQTGDQNGQGRQVFQVRGPNGITTIHVDRAQRQIQQGPQGPARQGGQSGGTWVQESMSQVHVSGGQVHGQGHGQGMPVPAMAKVDPPTVRQVFRSDTVSVSSPSIARVPDLNPPVTQKTSQRQTIQKLFLSTKQCNACPFDQCLDDYLNLENIFPGLFANPTKFLECRKYEKLFTLKKYDLVSEGLPDCTHPRFRRQLRPPSTRQFNDDDVSCCGTRPQVILPLTVESDNTTFNVVQLPNDRNQFLVQGICGHTRTRGCSVCAAEDNFQWVLVYDPRVDTSPPVSFVPVKFPHFCRCMNVARRTPRRRT